jgi:anti-sigma factor RsiW
MTDCSNAEIRDLLPDYLHEQLPAAAALLVEQHVTSCADCASELALLRSALQVRPRVVAVDVASIVASLPKPGIVVAKAKPLAASDATVRALSSAPSVARRSAFRGGRAWRAAAAITVVMLGGLSAAIARRGMVSVTSAGSTSDSAGSAVVYAALDSENGAATASSVGAGGNVGLPVGELSDYSDEEIETVIEQLDQWDGAAAADPLPGVPLLPADSGDGQ